ncbi:hypothetical protein ASE28_17535 [Acidovorax sp. Root219]|nr:hypothetical protein ASE28_17535 [Acidovorax sp. Root219]
MPLRHDGGVVHQDVKLSQLGDHFLDKWLSGSRIFLIALYRDRAYTLFPQSFDNSFRLLCRRDIADRNIRPTSSKRQRDLGAESTRAASNQGNFALEI